MYLYVPTAESNHNLKSVHNLLSGDSLHIYLLFSKHLKEKNHANLALTGNDIKRVSNKIAAGRS